MKLRNLLLVPALLVALCLGLVGCVAAQGGSSEQLIRSELPKFPAPAAQLERPELPPPPAPSQYRNVQADSAVRVLARLNAEKDYIKGFRVQVYAGSSEERANSVKGIARGLLLDENVYVRFEDPYFRVKAGDCWDRLEAYRIYVKLKGTFPTALIVPDDKVYIRKLN